MYKIYILMRNLAFILNDTDDSYSCGILLTYILTGSQWWRIH